MGRVVGNQVMIEEKRTRVESAEPKNWNIFEYMDSMKPEDWETHRGYLYRIEPRVASERGQRGEGFLMKIVEPFTIDFVREKFGGVCFRAYLKKGPERVADTTFTIEAPPKMQTEPQNYTTAHAPGASTDPTIRAMDIAADPNGAKTAVALTQSAAIQGFELLRNAMPAQQLSVRDIIELMDRRQPQGSGMPPWMEQALASMVPALVSKILTPENPIETFTKMVSALKDSPFSMNGRASSSDWKAELVSALPSIFDKGASMLNDYAKVANLQAQRALPVAPAGTTVPMAIQQPSAPIPIAPNPAASGGTQNVASSAMPPAEPPESWVKQKILEMFKAGRSGEEVAQWLDDTAPTWLNALIMFPPEQLIGFMQSDPDKILSQIADDPKMLQFLNGIVKWANDVDPSEAVAAAAVATQQPA